MMERAITFGTQSNLVGVITEPVRPGAARPGVILLNAGILHRVGPSRTYVKLARRLAQAGHTVLRFDHSGVGDSGRRRDTTPFNEAARQEVAEAMNLLESTVGITQFVLFGICSGARMALATASVDPRVVGVVSLDGWAVRTPRFWWNHYIGRLRTLKAWRDAVPTRIARIRRRFAAKPEQREVPPAVRIPTRDEMAQTLQHVVERGVQLLYIYTGGFLPLYNYSTQFTDSLPSVDFGHHLRLEYLPDADHMLTDLRHQEVIVEMIHDWLASWNGRAQPGAPVDRAASVGSGPTAH